MRVSTGIVARRKSGPISVKTTPSAAMAVSRDRAFRASSVVARRNRDGTALAGRAGSVIEPRYPTGRHRGRAGERRASRCRNAQPQRNRGWPFQPERNGAGGVTAAAAIAGAEVALAIRARRGRGRGHADQAEGRQEGGQGHGVHGEPSGAWWVGVLVRYNTKPIPPWAISHAAPNRPPSESRESPPRPGRADARAFALPRI